MVKPPFRLIFILLITAFIILILPCLLLLIPSHTTNPQCGVKDNPQYIAIKKEIARQDSIQLVKDPKLQQGSTLFNEAGCISCHDPFYKKVGPPLAKISSRRKIKWIRQTIWDFNKLVQKNNREAVALSGEYSQMFHPEHYFLTQEDIEKIIYYLNHVEKKRYLYEAID